MHANLHEQGDKLRMQTMGTLQVIYKERTA